LLLEKSPTKKSENICKGKQLQPKQKQSRQKKNETELQIFWKNADPKSKITEKKIKIIYSKAVTEKK